MGRFRPQTPGPIEPLRTFHRAGGRASASATPPTGRGMMSTSCRMLAARVPVPRCGPMLLPPPRYRGVKDDFVPASRPFGSLTLPCPVWGSAPADRRAYLRFAIFMMGRDKARTKP